MSFSLQDVVPCENMHSSTQWLLIMKPSIAYVLTILIIAASVKQSFQNDTAKPHNLIIGQRQSNDRLLIKQKVSVQGSKGVITSVVRNWNLANHDTITYVRVLDENHNGLGGFAKLIGGGAARKDLKLEFNSQRSQSINFSVEIYARGAL